MKAQFYNLDENKTVMCFQTTKILWKIKPLNWSDTCIKQIRLSDFTNARLFPTRLVKATPSNSTISVLVQITHGLYWWHQDLLLFKDNFLEKLVLLKKNILYLHNIHTILGVKFLPHTPTEPLGINAKALFTSIIVNTSVSQSHDCLNINRI